MEIKKFIHDKIETDLGKDDLSDILKFIGLLQSDYKTEVGKAIRNTDKYLAWNCIDVYVATSMRYRWEFEDVYEFIGEIFNFGKLKSMNLRIFDPTQSQCSNRFDKGLVESLILKRSQCTLFMVQEGDTFGKDSELAITLAQGKPVIAYVPIIRINERINKLKQYPLEYFQNMFHKFKAEGFIDKIEIREILSVVDKDYYNKIYYTFLRLIKKYRDRQPFTLYEKSDTDFKQKNREIFDLMCEILARLEEKYFDKRARTLKEIHPLALQVNLSNGVANGVLVVRDIKKCRELLYAILTNSMNFSIHFQKEETEDLGEFSYYYLEERISGCPFRIETKYKKLTNSYWNTFFETRSMQ